MNLIENLKKLQRERQLLLKEKQTPAIQQRVGELKYLINLARKELKN